MRLSAKVDYAVRAAIELAAHADAAQLVTTEQIAEAQNIPRPFLTNILQALRQHGVITSKRGPDGGHHLARPASEIVLADVMRAVDGPLAGVSGMHPEEVDYHGTARPLKEVWVAVRASLRDVLEHVTLEDLANDDLPDAVTMRTLAEDAWRSR